MIPKIKTFVLKLYCNSNGKYFVSLIKKLFGSNSNDVNGYIKLNEMIDSIESKIFNITTNRKL
jgi:hypothetical protein